ncbi:MAG: alpha-hydroxy-acid oxidizing protein, partial [Alphaproteobacteria bacterium]
MDLDFTLPALSDLRARAQRRLPDFAFEYLDSATGTEAGADRNRAGLDRVGFMPSILAGQFEPKLSTHFLGQDWSLPLGIAPIGMSGMIWPDAERILARKAAALQLVFGLSTVSASTPEAVGPLTDGRGWF